MAKRVPPILLTTLPSLFIAVRETARNHGLNLNDYVKAALMKDTGLDEKIFDKTPEEIRRIVRG